MKSIYRILILFAFVSVFLTACGSSSSADGDSIGSSLTPERLPDCSYHAYTSDFFEEEQGESLTVLTANLPFSLERASSMYVALYRDDGVSEVGFADNLGMNAVIRWTGACEDRMKVYIEGVASGDYILDMWVSDEDLNLAAEVLGIELQIQEGERELGSYQLEEKELEELQWYR